MNSATGVKLVVLGITCLDTIEVGFVQNIDNLRQSFQVIYGIKEILDETKASIRISLWRSSCLISSIRVRNEMSKPNWSSLVGRGHLS